MTYTMICPKCEKSREFYEVRERDPKTKKYWIITRCQKCGYNADIVRATNEARIDKRRDSGLVYPREPEGGWGL